jgi:hypothetical protein
MNKWFDAETDELQDERAGVVDDCIENLWRWTAPEQLVVGMARAFVSNVQAEVAKMSL